MSRRVVETKSEKAPEPSAAAAVAAPAASDAPPSSPPGNDGNADDHDDDDRLLLESTRNLVDEAVRRTMEEEGMIKEDDYLGKMTTELRHLSSGAATRTNNTTNTKKKRKLGDVERRIVGAMEQFARARLSILDAKRARRETGEIRHLVTKSLLDGTYYASVDRVWKPRPASYADPNHFEALRRDKAPAFVARSIAMAMAATPKAPDEVKTTAATTTTAAAPLPYKGHDKKKPNLRLRNEDVYAKTVSHATHFDYEAAVGVRVPPPLPPTVVGKDDGDEKGAPRPAAEEATPDRSREEWESSEESSSSHPTYPAKKPQDIMGQIWKASVWAEKCPTDRIISLIPKCPDKAALYYDVAACALGWADDATDWDTLQKFIYGSRRKITPAKVGDEDESYDNDNVDGHDEWVPGTGLKKIVPNKVRVCGGMESYDRRPCVLIVPVMDLPAMKNWCGQPYQAIVLTGTWPDDASGQRMIPLSRICSYINFCDIKETATPEQVEKARAVLEQVVLGLAHSLHYRLSRHESNLTRTQRAMLDRRREGFRTIPEAPESVYIPQAISHDNDRMPPPASLADPPSTAEGSKTAAVDSAAAGAAAGAGFSDPPNRAFSPPIRVRLVEFQGATDNDSTVPGHPAPDPLLLAVRAAVNWSWRNHQKVLESGEPEPEMHPLDVQAMEEYLEWRDDARRAQSMEDVAAGLGQPNGYQDGDESNNEELADNPDDHVADEADLYESVP